LPACNICGDRGIYISAGAAHTCRCVQELALGNRLNAAQLTQSLRRQTFDRFGLHYYSSEQADGGRTYRETAQIALRAARAFVEKAKAGPAADGLLFAGRVGTGKTFLACCIANALLDAHVQVLFLVVPDYLDRIRSTYDLERPGYTELELTEAAKRVPVLVLDDLGAHHYTEWGRQKLYSLVNHRLNHQLPVVVTTNVSLEDLEEYLGERTTSRLFQLCRPYRLLTDIDIRISRRLNPEEAAVRQNRPKKPPESTP